VDQFRRGLEVELEHGLHDPSTNLTTVYLGPNVEFPPPGYDAPGYVLRIIPKRLGGVGPWTEG
jgi:hypothetical protein